MVLITFTKKKKKIDYELIFFRYNALLLPRDNIFLCSVADPLKQRCPTLSPFATCGDRLFKCDDNHNFFIFIY